MWKAFMLAVSKSMWSRKFDLIFSHFCSCCVSFCSKSWYVFCCVIYLALVVSLFPLFAAPNTADLPKPWPCVCGFVKSAEWSFILLWYVRHTGSFEHFTCFGCSSHRELNSLSCHFAFNLFAATLSRSWIECTQTNIISLLFAVFLSQGEGLCSPWARIQSNHWFVCFLFCFFYLKCPFAMFSQESPRKLMMSVWNKTVISVRQINIWE